MSFAQRGFRYGVRYNQGRHYALLGGAYSYTPGALLTSFTNTRASTAAYYDVNGVVQFASTGVLRDAHWIGGIRHLLTEPTSTNLCTFSDALNSWTAVSTPTVTTAVADVYGTTAACNVSDTSAAAIQGVKLAVTLTGAGSKGVSLFVKKGTVSAATGSTIILRDTTAVANRLLATLTWAGSVPSIAITTGVAQKNDTLGNGWFRIELVASNIINGNAHEIEIDPAGTLAEQGDLNVCGVQVEDLIVCSSIIRTSGSTAARANEVVSVTPRLAQSIPMTLYYDETCLNTATGRMISFANSSETAPFFKIRNGSAMDGTHSNSGISTGTVALTVVRGTRHEGRLVLTPDFQVQCFSANSGGSETAGAVTTPGATAFDPWTGTAMNIGGVNNTEFPRAFRKIVAIPGIQAIEVCRAA